MSDQPDMVNHPPHYTSHPSGVECIDIVKHYPFCLGAAVKYIWRCGLKAGADEIEDLQKAVWYLNQEIELRKARRDAEQSSWTVLGEPAGVRISNPEITAADVDRALEKLDDLIIQTRF